MAQNNQQLLKTSLGIFALIAFIYGILFLIVPEMVVKTSGGGPVPPGWLRWSGGLLVALSFGAYNSLKDPLKETTFVTTLAMANLLCGLALIYSLLFERDSDVWFSLTPGIINLILAVLLWVGLKQAKTEKTGG